MIERLSKLREGLVSSECDAFVSLAPPTNQYLAGFRGTTSGVIVSTQDAWFLCDFRYTEQAGEQVSGYRIEEVSGSFTKRVGEKLAALGLKRVAYEPSYMTVDVLTALESAYSGELVPVADLVTRLRLWKDLEEIERIRSASLLAEGVLADVIEEAHAGMLERELAARIEYEFKKRGASGASFDTIALFGSRSSLPHGQPGDKPLESGDIVLLDFGCRRDGYCSDLTRTYSFGTITGHWFDSIYAITLEAQRRALAAVRPGVTGREVDAVARDHISSAGYGANFGHGLGHGVGIEIHEAPRLNPESDTVLEEGMVVTVEPGIYLPGRGGVRIEDLVVVTKDGCEVLTQSSKELRILAA